MCRFVGARLRAPIVLVPAVLVVLFACRDVTHPSELVPGGPRRSTLPDPGPVVVTPGNLHGWTFYDDQHDTACGDSSVCLMVSGPAGQPSGSGSAELAVPTTSDGKALVLAQYQGVRFDHLTTLRYATYRQTADPGNNLAISLQFNADYDLNDAAVGYQGRLVFEPYRAAGGTVTQGVWQEWDAQAGKWWGTKATVPKNGANVANPCVQATPCTWQQLLTAFPNVGVHSTYGVVVLKAGSGWSGFRGNVDKLAIGVDGVTTTFDFELAAALVHLHTSIPASVAGTRLPADSDYTPGATVQFDFSAAPNHQNLVVVLDDTLSNSSGSIVMNAPHTIEADADSIIAVSPAVADLEGRVTALLTASDKRAAYSDFLQWYIDRAKVIGPDALAAQLRLANHFAIDPYRDANALRAFDDTLAGTVFEVDHFNGQDYVFYYTPEDYGGGVFASRGRASGLGLRPTGRTGNHRVPAAVLSRSSVRRPQLGAARSTAVTSDQSWATEQTAIMYVNGVNTVDVDDNPLHTSATGTTDRLRDLMYGIPGVRDAHGTSGNVVVTHFYNRNLAAQLAAYDSAHVCIARAILNINLGSALVAGVRYAGCKGVRYSKILIENDIVESVIEFVQNRLHIPTPLVADVANMAAALKLYQDAGYHTIVVAHSQGNMLSELAEQRLPNLTHRPLQDTVCTAHLTMASPIELGAYRLDHNFIRGFSLHGDILLVLGLPNDFPKFDTDTSLAGAAEEAYLRAHFAAPEEILKSKLRWGLRIHGVDYNYLTYPESQDRMETLLGELRDECMAGSIVVTPSAVTIPLGDSVKVHVTVRSRAGHTLIGREFNGGGLVAVVNHDSMIVATAPGTELAPVNLHQTGETLGYVSVTVPPVPFPGTVREYLTSIWVDTAGFSPNDSTAGLPPRPSPEPTWDGTPGGCSQSTRTTAGTAYKDWAQRCSRLYVLEVPADPMPVRTRLRLKLADYPGGLLSNGPIGTLLTPGVPVADTLSYRCGPEYCLRMAVLQSLNAGNVLMSSDTLCFSDSCNASLLRVPARKTGLPPTTPRRPTIESAPAKGAEAFAPPASVSTPLTANRRPQHE